MFFIFSKILTFLISPLIWIIVLFLTGLISKNKILKKRCIISGAILLLFFTNGFLFGELIRMWEISANNKTKQPVYEAGIVLGGMSVYDQDLDRVQFFRSVDRLLQTVELYRKGIIKKIVFTGGSGRILHPEMKEGYYLERYFQYFNIPAKDVLIEGESKNTYENALFTKKLLEKEHIAGRLLLITSGFHMRRGQGCFAKQGIVTDSYTTDRYVFEKKNFEFDYLFLPNASYLDAWANFIHELVGYVTYKITGYI